jgi:hypothetical protein
VGVGVGVGVLVGVGVGVGLGAVVASGVGVGEGAGSELAAALDVGAGDAEGVGDAEGLAARGLDVAVGELCRKTAAARVTAPCCPLRVNVLEVAAGRVAHGPDAAAGRMRASPYNIRATAGWEEPLPSMNSPVMRPKTVTPKATNRARRSITDTMSPPCRPARGYRLSPP